jgi:hypothetical protein
MFTNSNSIPAPVQNPIIHTCLHALHPPPHLPLSHREALLKSKSCLRVDLFHVKQQQPELGLRLQEQPGDLLPLVSRLGGGVVECVSCRSMEKCRMLASMCLVVGIMLCVRAAVQQPKNDYHSHRAQVCMAAAAAACVSTTCVPCPPPPGPPSV